MAFVKPNDLFTTQKKESLKYEKNIDPTQADRVANTGSTPNSKTIGAEIDADVNIATVPDPCINLINVDIINGNNNGFIFIFEIEVAILDPTPDSVRTFPKAPPPPVTRIIIPADWMPISNSFITLSLDIFLVRVIIAITKPIPTATIGVPKNTKALKIPFISNPFTFERAPIIVFIKMSIIGTIIGKNAIVAYGIFSFSSNL